MILAALAYRPFLDPLNLHGPEWWLLLAPLCLGVAMVYKAVRVESMRRYWFEVAMMTTQIVAGMVLLAVGIYVFFELIAPMLG